MTCFNRKRHYANGRHLIAALLLGAFIAGAGVMTRRLVTAPEGENLPAAERQELATFSQEIRQGEHADSLRTTRHGRKRGGYRTPETFAFDPNTADSLTLLRLGLRPWQAANMLKYRRHGGRWHSPDDFARLYGLPQEDFRRLRPFIRIAPQAEAPSAARDSARRLPRYEKVEKYAPGTIVDLNEADTTTLKGIPGIGSYYAAKICRYRERLGGFVSVAQIGEVEGLPADITRWVSVVPGSQPRRINVNQATFKELVRHPYLSYEQVKTICSHRQKYGNLKGWDELKLYDGFAEEQIERLQPYFVF